MFEVLEVAVRVLTIPVPVVILGYVILDAINGGWHR